MWFSKYLAWIFISITLLGCNSSSKPVIAPSAEQTGQETQEETASTENVTQTPLRIACVGDSLTQGYGYVNAQNESYPVQLSKLIDNTSMQVKNFGVSNKTAMSTEINISKTLDPYNKTQEYKDSLAFNLVGNNSPTLGSIQIALRR